MAEKQQDNSIQLDAVSPLATDKSYGEKVYDTIFNKGFNFWVNLAASAAFSQWVANGTGRMRLPGMKTADTPRGVQAFVSGKLEQHVMPLFKPVLPKGKSLAQNADATTQILTLQIPGHFILIPSVWLGAKMKPAIVKYFNKKHYGDAADDDPSIKLREEMVAAEAKPTLLGAVTARIATLPLSLATSAIIGSPNNLITSTGKKHNIELMSKFPGLNEMAARMGEGMGEGIVHAVPAINAPRGLNTRLQKHLGWSEDQLKAFKEAGVTPGKYDRGVQDFMRFTAIDTAYTWLLSAGIHPILNLLRKVPGMTYTDRPPVPGIITNDAGEITKLRQPKNRMGLAEAVEPKHTNLDADTPRIHVGEIKHHGQVKAQEQELHA